MKKKLILFGVRIYLNSLSIINPKAAGRIGFYLFCRPRRRPVKEHHLEFLNSAQQSTVEYDGKQVRRYQWGSGPQKLLLLHGWESHSYWWKSIVTTLPQDQFTFVAVDAPGHGQSDGDYINIPHYSGLIEQLLRQDETFHGILAHSLGAFSTIYTFHRLSDLPSSKLVIMAAPGEATDFITYYRQALGLSDRTMAVIRKYFIDRLGHAPEYFSLPALARNVSVPGLIIHDRDDRDAPFRHALAAHQNWPASQMIATTGLGHNLKSTELIADVQKFLLS